MKTEISELMHVMKMNFATNRKEKKPEIAWEKINNAIEANLNKVKESLNNSSNFFEIIFNQIHFRDYLIIEMIRSLLYRKFVLW